MKKTLQNIGVFALGLMMSVTLAIPAPASAQTMAELQTMIAQLQAQLNILLGGGSTTPAFTYTRDLTLGSTGADVVALQTFLESKMVLTIPAGVSKGYFGELTRAALARYQASVGISPAVGYFGPITRARVNQESVVVVTPPATPGTPSAPNLSGEGDIEIDVVLDSDVSIDLGKSEDVIEIEVEAVDGDVRMDRMDFFFDARPWLYFAEVNLLVDGKEVSSLTRQSDFTQVGSDYRARFSGLDKIIEEDESVIITLELRVLPSMAGDRDLHTVKVSMDNSSIRFIDGAGATLFGGQNVDVDVDFSDTFGEGDIDVTIGDNSPERATIVLDEDNRTNGVTVLEFNVEANNSDIEIQDVTVEFASNTSSTSSLLYRAYLYRGSTLLKSKSVTSDTVIFDDIEYAIDEDDTETFTVKVDFNKTDGLTIDEFTVVEVIVDAENEDFEVTTDDLSVNETHQLVVEGLVEEFISKSSKTIALGQNKSNVVYTFEFELTAYEETFYIAEDGSGFTIILDGASTTVVATTIASTNASLVNNGDSYRINKGQTRTFRVDVEVAANEGEGSVSARATIDALDYFTALNLSGTAQVLTLGAPDYRSATVTVFDNN